MRYLYYRFFNWVDVKSGHSFYWLCKYTADQFEKLSPEQQAYENQQENAKHGAIAE